MGNKIKKISVGGIIYDLCDSWARESLSTEISRATITERQLENTKMGIIHRDTFSGRYLIFANSDARDTYLEDPESNASLVIGSFDTQAQYVAEINLITSDYNAVLLGSTGNDIRFNFDIKNLAGDSVGDSITCTYTIVRGGTKKVITEKYRNKTEVVFNIDPYLNEGDNTISINIVGNSTLASTTIGVTYQVVNLVLTSNYDISTVHNLFNNSESKAEIPYYISGTGFKTVEWFLDGIKLEHEANDDVTEVTSNRTKYIPMSGLSQGTHSIQARAYITINGENFYSNILYMDAIVYTATDNRDPIIGVSTVIPFSNGIISDSLVFYNIEQYIPHTFTFTVFNPIAATTEVSILLGEVLYGSVSTSNNDVISYTIIPTIYGDNQLRIEAKIDEFNAIVYPIQCTIAKSSSNLEENNNNLVLNLSSVGRTNNDLNLDTWVFGEFTTKFTGFNWNNTSGWVNNRLVISDGSDIEINIAPFSNKDLTSKGFTLELEFSTDQVNNESAILCDLRNSSGKGLLLTASEASLTSSGDATINTKFKSGENIRIAFVINPATGANNKGLIFIYIDGILSGASNYAENDNFLSDSLLKFGGTTEAIIKLKQIRIYNSALTSDEILSNYILYRDSSLEMLNVFNRNNILDGRFFNLDTLASQCPVLKITGNIPALENTTNKDETIYVDVEYVNVQDPDLSFTGKYLRMKPQGTSSMGYPKKNFRLYTAKHDDSKIFDSTGKEIVDRLYSFKKGSQPVDCWCFKADYAESSGTHNTGIARIWNKVMYDAQIDGDYKLRTEAQKKALESNYKYDVRTTIDGFPCHLVYRLDENSDWIYIGKYNFNNDKSTESVFGFTGIPGFDNSKMQCWEVLNNGNHLALFEDTDNFDTEWTNAFESRYPDVGDKADISDLKAFCEWVVSTKNNVEKFKEEKWDHLDVYKAAAYYIYVMRFGAVDQTVKNSMLTSEDGIHFYWINYDNDTINGLRNDGLLVFDYLIDRNSLDPSYTNENVFVYAGHNSTLWNNMEADAEFMNVVAKVDQALYLSGLNYSEVVKMFDDSQSSKWCERVYNQDALYKYIGPYNNNGVNNLFMLQGARRSHRRWWLSHRFDLIDSKFISGKYKAKVIDFKVKNDTEIGQKFTIRSGNLLFYGYGVNDIPVETGIKLDKGEEYTFTTVQVLNIGDPVRIYSAPNIQKLDLSQLMSRLTQLGLGGVYDSENGSQLKELILGDGLTTNTGLEMISGLDQATSLEVLDIRGMKDLSNVDLGNIKTLKIFRSKGSGLTSFSPSEGSVLSEVSLPNTLKALTLKSLSYLNLENLDIESSGINLSTIQISNCPNLTKDFQFFYNWCINKTTTDDKLCRLEIDNIDWENITPEQLLEIGQLKVNGGILKLKGKVSITRTDEEIIDRLVEIFGSNCFSNVSDFFIKAPDAIYLSGPDSLIEGSQAEYIAAVFGNYVGKVSWNITGGKSSDKIDKNGLLTTGYMKIDRTITIEATHIPTQGNTSSVTKQVNVVSQVRPYSGNIIGESYASNGSKYTLTITPDIFGREINTEFDVFWSLSGVAYDEGNVSINTKSSNKEFCILECASGKTGSFNLTATIRDCSGKDISVTKTIELGVKLTINLTNNQDIDLSSLHKSLKVSELTENGSVNRYLTIVDNSVYAYSGAYIKVSFPNYTGYKTPETITLVLGDEDQEVEGIYLSELVRITLSSYDNGSLNGAVVRVGEVDYSWSGEPITAYTAFDSNYTIQFSRVGEYLTPDKLEYIASQDERNIDIIYKRLPEDIIIINQTISDPGSMITGFINPEVIQTIRSNSHRYLGKYTDDGIMKLCQLDDNNSTKYFDGTSADLTGSEGDVFMKMPEFWYRSHELDTDVWGIRFQIEEPQEDGWNHWDTNTLIGVYKGWDNNNKLYSYSTKEYTGSLNKDSFNQSASARGNGFQIIDWQMHCIMALLYCAQYGHTNCQLKIGDGNKYYNRETTGKSNTCGMNDTKGVDPVPGLNDDGISAGSSFINFWGLEDWWGGRAEFIKNIVYRAGESINGYQKYYLHIYEHDGTTRTSEIPYNTRRTGLITKLYFGKYCDVYPKEGISDNSNTTYFCDRLISEGNPNQTWHFCRGPKDISGLENTSYGGMFSLDSYAGSLSGIGSRLAFRGNCVIVDNVEEFKNLVEIS